MHTISVTQALDVWASIEEAYNGVSSFGGDTAEIYIQRLMPAGLVSDVRTLESKMFAADARAAFTGANACLHDLLALFAEKRSCEIKVDGRKLGPWLRETMNAHRVHVQVLKE